MKEVNHFSFKDSLGPWIGRTMKVIDNRIEDVLAENKIDLSRMQFVILKNIEENEGICQNELAFYCNRNKSSLKRMIDTLIRKGYVTKTLSKEDKRKNTIYISTSGIVILKRALPHFKNLAVIIEQNLSMTEIEHTKKIFNTIQKNITNHEGVSFINKNS